MPNANLTDSQILCLRYLLRFSMDVDKDESWPELDGLVARGLLRVFPWGELKSYEATVAGRDAVKAAMALKGATASA